MSQNIQPVWPIIISYQNDPELDYLQDEDEWHGHADLQNTNFQAEDRLIDLEGRVFYLKKSGQGKWVYSGEVLSLEKILGLIKGHLSCEGNCCVAKLYAPTIKDAFNMLKKND